MFDHNVLCTDVEGFRLRAFINPKPFLITAELKHGIFNLNLLAKSGVAAVD